MTYKILIVEDMPEILDNICDFFLREGMGLLEIVRSSDGSDALKKIEKEMFDLMILDIMLPGVSGFDLCKAAKKRGDCPIILLTALGSENTILKGYELGCDDYVVKPFVMRHLYAKCLALLRRAEKKTRQEILTCGAIAVNKGTMSVTVSGCEIDIKSREYTLLFYLMSNQNVVLSRQSILDHVWSDNYEVNDRAVDNSIRRLRECLGEAGRQIKTVFGRGYKITEGKG